MDSSEDK